MSWNERWSKNRTDNDDVIITSRDEISYVLKIEVMTCQNEVYL